MQLGLYEHYKGKRYLVIGVAQHTETDQTLVIYVPLYDDSRETKRGMMAARPLSMFSERVIVDPMSREIARSGIEVPRFKYVGPGALPDPPPVFGGGEGRIVHPPETCDVGQMTTERGLRACDARWESATVAILEQYNPPRKFVLKASGDAGFTRVE